MKYQVHTFGCKVNTYDSGLIQKNLQGSGYHLLHKNEIKLSPDTKIHVLNTCAVTQEATKEAVRLIRRIKAKEPLSTIVVTGCAAQVDTDSFQSLPGADLIVANSHKSLLPQILDQYFKGEIKEKVFKSNIFRKEDLEMGGGIEKHHSRSFLKIQDGCNSFCTYCIIPFARGKSRSIPIAHLIERINDLYHSGIREVVLTGVHVGDYEDVYLGQKKNLEDLLEFLLQKTMMPRFRLASLEPVEVSDRMLELYQDSRLCPHFHMSIQSANTEVLHAMKRHYGQEEVVTSLNKIARYVPGSFVGMDVIVGFPTETAEQFEDTLNILTELEWTKIHVFPYSERQGTFATRLTDIVSEQEKNRRAEVLRQLSLERYELMAKKQIGTTKEVLVLKNAAKGGHCLSRDYWPVEILGDTSILQNWQGQLVQVKVVGYQNNSKNKMEGHLTAEVIL